MVSNQDEVIFASFVSDLFFISLEGLGKNNSLEFVLEPLDSILFSYLMTDSHTALSDLSPGYSGSGPGQTYEEVHSVNSSGGVVLNSEINVLIDSESEVSSIREVPLEELVLLYLKTTLQNFKGLLSTYGNVNSNLLITTNSERTEGVSGLGEDRLLSSKLFQNTGSTGETITRLSNTAVKDQLVNLDIPHGILLIIGGHG